MTKPSLTLNVSRLLWKTRGEHWDYEFIATPDVPSLPAWSVTLEEVLGDADPRTGDLFYGVLELIGDGGGAHPYAAVRFLDPDRKDWTGRPIQHLAVWFPAIGQASVPDVVPTDWHLQALAALGSTYGKDEAFAISEEQIRGWSRDEKASRAAYVAGIVKSTPPIIRLVGPIDPLRWSQRPSIKREVLTKPVAGLPAERPLPSLFIVALLTSLLAFMLRWITRLVRRRRNESVR